MKMNLSNALLYINCNCRDQNIVTRNKIIFNQIVSSRRTVFCLA